MLRRIIAIYLLILLYAGCTTKVFSINESSETITNWHKAKEYQRQERYELAKQYYLLALASAREQGSQEALQRELKVVERMIQSIR